MHNILDLIGNSGQEMRYPQITRIRNNLRNLWKSFSQSLNNHRNSLTAADTSGC